MAAPEAAFDPARPDANPLRENENLHAVVLRSGGKSPFRANQLRCACHDRMLYLP